MRHTALALVTLCLGCFESPSNGQESLHQDNTCNASLAYANSLGGTTPCPPTYAEALATRCAFDFGTLSAGRCGALLQFDVNLNVHGWTCFYDPSSRALVGRYLQDDVASYCDRRSSSLRGGQVDLSCTTRPTTDLNVNCSRATDASASDASGG